MSCHTHTSHDHKHGGGCGHQQIEHEGHIDYVHDGHLHHMHNDHVDEHKLMGGSSQCTPQHICGGHEKEHVHGDTCGHATLPHDDHTDYLVDGHLHHPCGSHCDDHGVVAMR